MTTTTMDIQTLAEAARSELAYLARQARVTHPRGDTDNGGRWYPGAGEGGRPSVRTPSRRWPWSYMLACRTRRWCARLPAETRDADAQVGAVAIAAGRLEPSPRLVKLLASA